LNLLYNFTACCMKTAYYSFLLLFAVASSLHLKAQPDRYILNGSATRNSCNCYTLTTNTQFQAGSVWNKVKINLTDAFDFSFNIYLGCTDAEGADGIVFIMQPISTSVGAAGEGMGFEGVQPSIGITLDTWQNANRNDPAFDHISIQKNGTVNHGNDLAGPVAASPVSDNIEDCKWHLLRIGWDPSSKKLRSYFDGILRVEATVDLIGDVFNNDPMVYWGFSAATGGSFNLQQFCTALNPKMTAVPDTACIQPNGNTVVFNDKSESFAPITNYFWDFGDGTTSTDANPPNHVYQRPGIYNVKMAITGMDGCFSDTLTRKLAIGSLPKAAFNIYDTCERLNPRVTDQSTNEVGKISTRKWIINASQEQTTLTPNLSQFPVGRHELALVVTSEYGCVSNLASQTFIVKERPKVAGVVNDGCIKEVLSFEGQQLGAIAIDQWFWNFGDGQTTQLQSPQHAYTRSGEYALAVWALGENGCFSDTVNNRLRIEEAVAFAGKDTIVVMNTPFMLKGGGNGDFSWWPSGSLNDAASPSPVATLSDYQTYILTVTTAAGCTGSDDVVVTVFKGSSVYVPNAFTPNNDRKNDVLKPAYIGIKKLHNYSLYDRWGELVFKTTDMSKGWDGTFGGSRQALPGTYVWILEATDYLGKVNKMKGTTTLIR
jgi:gliding motility-associated-like protein